MKKLCASLLAWLGALLCASVLAAEAELTTFKPQDIVWKDYPAIPGLKLAVTRAPAGAQFHAFMQKWR